MLFINNPIMSFFLFGGDNSKAEQTPLTQKLIELTISGNLSVLRNEVRGRSNIELIKDYYGNNLLQIATRARRYEMMSYLIDLNIFSLAHLNRFDETVFDIAVKNHDNRAFEILIRYDKGTQDAKMKELETQNKLLLDDNQYFEKEIVKSITETDNLKRKNKRLLDENNKLESDNKKLRQDIIKYQDMLKK